MRLWWLEINTIRALENLRLSLWLHCSTTSVPTNLALKPTLKILMIFKEFGSRGFRPPDLLILFSALISHNQQLSLLL
jgi:hypothetical protein